MQKGPISFASYMEKCLLDETNGYYMKRDVFNSKGDFITSPEISQLFGEMIGIWCVNFLEKAKIINFSNKTLDNKKKFSLLEFGPGRGTLMIDIIRVFQMLGLLNGLEINFVEYSPFMRKLQQTNILKQLQKYDIWMKYEYEDSKKSKVEKFTCENKDINLSLRWFRMYEHMLYEDFGSDKILKNSKKEENICPIIVLAHEFFDALPVNIFSYNKDYGWCEKLVNIAHNSSDHHLEFTLSEGENQNVKKILNPHQLFSKDVKKSLQTGDTLEISPRSLVITNSISELINKVDGAALIIDYGENQSFSNSIRAIRNHKFIEEKMFLDYPGECDLSAYVNFMSLAAVANKVDGIKTWGPMPQGLFLESMGINQRLELLSQAGTASDRKRLESECQRLISQEEMGEIYKVFYIGRKEHGEIFPFITENPQVFF